MTSITKHPVVAWGLLILAVISAVVMLAGTYIYGENLQRSTDGLHGKVVERTERIYRLIEKRNEEKRVLDRTWLKADSDQAQSIEAQIQNLRTGLNVDASLMYQLGVRDGQRLCVQ